MALRAAVLGSTPSAISAAISLSNGEATARYAKAVRECVGLERSAHMRFQAVRNAQAAGAANVEIREFDILNSPTPKAEFDSLVSQRMLINLASWDEQQQGIRNLLVASKVCDGKCRA